MYEILYEYTLKNVIISDGYIAIKNVTIIVYQISSYSPFILF